MKEKTKKIMNYVTAPFKTVYEAAKEIYMVHQLFELNQRSVHESMMEVSNPEEKSETPEFPIYIGKEHIFPWSPYSCITEIDELDEKDKEVMEILKEDFPELVEKGDL